ncbi:MAG: type IX secretion system protein PorQ [Bacteroidia bacterium]
MKITKALFSGLLLFVALQSSAQIGGTYVYQFLNIPASARIAGLGGTFITAKDNDLNLALQAPSLLDSSMHKSLAFSGVTYADGIGFGDAAFAYHKDQIGTFFAAIHYANYGTFDEADEFGNITGTFKASDYALSLGYGRQLNPLFSVGGALKILYSDMYLYNSFGLGLDLSATYCDTNSQVVATFEIKNAGVQIKHYIADNSEKLPGEALIGVSKRLVHTPLRFSLTYRHLENFDMAYTDPNDLGEVDPVTGVAQVQEYDFFNKFSRHFIFAGEILLTKNFHLNFGYNFQRRRELVVDTRPGTVGLSFGVSIKISKFIITYGRGNYHLAGGADHFSITTNLSEFGKKGK